MTEKPKANSGDYLYALLRGGVSTIPVVGSTAAELLSVVIEPPLSKRRDKWVESIANDLKTLEQTIDNFSMKKLAGDETFVTALVSATQAAIRTHQEEKLQMLRNAVLNTALGQNPDETLTSMFLSFIDGMTSLHIRVLTKFDKSDDISIFAGSPLPFVKEHVPELADSMEVYEQIVRDLYGRGLVDSNITSGTATGFGKFGGTTTQLGHRFLNFIAAPSALQSDATRNENANGNHER